MIILLNFSKTKKLPNYTQDMLYQLMDYGDFILGVGTQTQLLKQPLALGRYWS
jgi:hypothetical protein